MTPQQAEHWMKIMLRIIGSFSLTAVVFVVVPHSWMNAIHSWLGMGELPATPIIIYLTRSISAIYALLGVLMWTSSYQPARYRSLLRNFGWAIVLFGAALIAIDIQAGLPAFWTWWEGPFTIAFGCAMAYLADTMREHHADSE